MATGNVGPDEESPVRLGVFGGTFDPPHVGHVTLTRELRESGVVDEILWIPVAIPPHKPSGPRTSPDLRMEMVHAAIGGRANQSASNIELLREGPSYTVDTLRALRSEHPEATPVLIMGSDQFAELAEWHKAEEVVQFADVCVLPRGGVELDSVRPRLSVVWCAADVASIDVSSSDIRKRVREGRPYRHLVPEAVAEIIEREDLYGQ
ncbi:MAG: nicotinate-nucleotide adenylyltransferase [Gemmatimonadota bacterium]|nr:nicotinate-nucleotide adenylyltransferase [Gemmatimonadota bacterium]